jgi:nicotinamide-nucleotide amidase
MFSDEVTILCQNLGQQCKQNGIHLVTAESCTGGLLAAAITSTAGSSKWFERGYVTYSNQSKMNCLSINENDLQTFGAVSAQIAQQMAAGALKNTSANLSISITGIAGPSGGSKDKPIGTVFFACLRENKVIFEHKALFVGNREIIRDKAVIFAINTLLKLTL